jgi:phospholipid N-methyltransferase
MSLNKFEYLIESIKNWKNSGTITQSGPSLCKKMVEHIDSKTKYIAEYGAGDGVITKYILDKMPSDGLLLAFEINENLYELLCKINDPRLKPIYDSAEKIEEYCRMYEIENLDTIVSGIPFVVLPTELTIEILESSKKALKKKGLFVQFHYSKILKGIYQTIFQNFTTEYVLLNTPPAFVFRCEKQFD